jgi:hypothetical protein
MASDGRKSASIKFGTPGPAFEDGLFGINAEITRKGYIGGISAQLLNNRKLFSGADSPAGGSAKTANMLKTGRKKACAAAILLSSATGG